jgi:hypothetical protein
MAAIRIVEAGSVPWMTPVSGQGGEMVEVDEPGARGAIRLPHPGSDGQLYLHESSTPPNMEVLPHVHRVDEIIYVTRGELHLGARVLRPGDSVYIPADTLYGFRAGPEGLGFLNFRGSSNRAHVMKDDFLAERAETRTSA